MRSSRRFNVNDLKKVIFLRNLKIHTYNNDIHDKKVETENMSQKYGPGTNF